ncbi:hypothetical protein VE01_03813 [Pseudogymnoascus verrucosus]|uniref:Major facilitator superfamily (MFS) profile domain-containing protein n=1 Tax=Pseudogymnoascus verrucosus TaxID=342668 RepID=A0A1B8GQX0_9PEZI|nr:uncharacterized protein VE01_03813 [Pseudogymnoascus verrucosus]OBT98229.1 hypothetical protein VE01_03813 [Pseudogymnoascus verrucosus]
MNDRKDLGTASENNNLDDKPLEANLKSEGEAVVSSEAVETTPKEDEIADYPHGTRLVIITIALCLSVLCFSLDNTIIATAIPRITDEFHALDDVGCVTAFFIGFYFQSPGRTSKPKFGWRAQLNQFDAFGTLLFVPSIVCLLLALQFGGSKYYWANAKVIALFVLFGVLFVGFVLVQLWKGENATVHPRIFKVRNVWGSVVFNITLGASFFVVVYFIPIWFQAIKGASPIKSGVMNIPIVLAVIICTFISWGGITASGYYGPFLLFPSVVSSVGVGLLTTFHVDSGHASWIGYQVLYGMGIGAGMQVCFVVVQVAVPPVDIPVAMALVVFAQTLGGAIFVSVSDTIFSNLLVQNLADAVPGLSPYIVSSTGATALKNVITPQYLPGVLVAYNHTITQTWYAAVALAAVSIIGGCGC